MSRIKIIIFTITAAFLFLLLCIFNLEVVRGARYREISHKNCIRLIPQEASRGRILDRNQDVIVDNKLCYDAMLMPQDARYTDRAIMHASQILGTDSRILKDTFLNWSREPFSPILIAKDISVKEAISLEELRPDINGILIKQRPQRYYPYTRLACHALGYLGEIDRWRLTRLVDYGYKTKDIMGFGGVEELYDYYLRQEEGGLSVEVDHRGRLTRILGFRPPKKGKDIQLTLDLRLQKIAESVFSDKKGCVIIMDPYNGEILTLVSRPGFSPSVFTERSNFIIRGIFNNPDAPLLNRAIAATYPAGSIFKLVVAAAALETGKLDLSRKFYCSGKTYVGRQEFACWDMHLDENLLEAIRHSCNVFFYKTGLLLGPQIIYDFAVKFGFSRPTYIDLPYEKRGFLPNPLWKNIYRFKNWLDGDTANFSIGQGELLVTPLQVTRMMAVFANKGFLVVPHIIKSIGGRPISGYEKKITPVGIKENTIDIIKEGLREAVSEPSGTAHILGGLGVSVAGKTGTAQAPPKPPHGWFVGFFPFPEPRYVICVFLEHGLAGHFACVVGRDIIEMMYKEGLI